MNNEPANPVILPLSKNPTPGETPPESVAPGSGPPPENHSLTTEGPSEPATLTPRTGYSQLPLILWHVLLRFWRPGQRTLTPLETATKAEVARLREEAVNQQRSAQSEALRLRADIDERDSEIRRLHLELEIVTSRLKVAQVEISGLAEVVARDRKRVEAETAALAQRVAEATLYHPER
jgi:hypothetical protein